MGKKAQFGGDDVKDLPRKFGVVSQERTIDYDGFLELFRKYGGEVASEATVASNDPQVVQDAAPTIVTRLKAAGVTTVVTFADFTVLRILMQSASTQEWHPEWFFTGAQVQDIGILVRGFPTDQSQHAFGISSLTPWLEPDPTPPPPQLSYTQQIDPLNWYWGVGSGTSSQRITGFLVGWLLTGIHTAGPNLTPKTFVQGLYSNPPRGGALEGRADIALVAYGPGPKLPYNGYAGIGLDFAPYWWDTETTGPSNGLGTVGQGCRLVRRRRQALRRDHVAEEAVRVVRQEPVDQRLSDAARSARSDTPVTARGARRRAPPSTRARRANRRWSSPRVAPARRPRERSHSVVTTEPSADSTQGDAVTTWDQSVDLVIAGSGGGGVVAALVAIDAGLEPLVLEKQAIVGGSTGMSGGIIWMPNNPLMRAEGVADSHEDGLAYLEDVVGDAGPASSPERRETFLTEGYKMLTFLQRKGVRLVRCEGYSDYYPNAKGGNARGRSVEGVPFDARQLGEWHDKLQPSLAKGYGLAVKTNELRSVQYFNRSPQSFATAARVFLRTQGRRVASSGAAHQRRVADGADAEGPDRPHGRAADLDEHGDGRSRRRRRPGGRRPRDEGRRAGPHRGSEGSAARGRWLRPQRRDATQVQREPAERGAVVDRQRGRHRGGARDGDAPGRQDRPARRGVVAPVNRSLARGLLTRRGAATAARDLRRLDRSTVLQRVELLCRSGQGDVRAQGGALLAHLRRGLLPRVRAVGEPLAAPVAGGGVRERRGAEGGHARGVGAPDRRRSQRAGPHGATLQRVRGQGPRSRTSGGDSRRTTTAWVTRATSPTPSLGPLDRAPYYATEIYPGDVGTCGGLITNEHAQVLDESDTPIPGSVRDRQRHRDRDGSHLSGCGREHREHHGLRLRRGSSRRADSDAEGR